MARLKKGVPTGQRDLFGVDICIGDTLSKVGVGIQYEVDWYGGLSDMQGNRVHNPRKWNGSEYEIIQQLPERLPAVSEDTLEEAVASLETEVVPVLTAKADEVNAVVSDESVMEEPQEAKAEEQEKEDISARTGKITTLCEALQELGVDGSLSWYERRIHAETEGHQLIIEHRMEITLMSK